MLNISSSKSGRRTRRASVSEINVTPLVDVMLVLLVVFMITSPLLVAGVKVDLPQTTHTPIAGQEEPLSITVDKDNKVYIQNTQIDIKNLNPKLIAITKQNYETRIFVRGDKNVGYGMVMEVISHINKAGFNKIALLTESKNE